MDEQLQSQSTDQPQAQISPVALASLKSTVPWMRFLAILGMVITGFMVLGGLVAMAKMPFGFIVFLFYLIIAAIVFFPQLYLLQYANSIKGFLESNNTTLLERAFEKQKSYWMYLGILLIIYLAIVVLFLLIFAFAGATIFSLMKHNPYMQQ
jgi:hypothetical protein